VSFGSGNQRLGGKLKFDEPKLSSQEAECHFHRHYTKFKVKKFTSSGRSRIFRGDDLGTR